MTLQALADLRSHRRRRRMGDIDWFDAAYRVYLVGGFGGGGVLWISSSVKDGAVSAHTADSVLRHGPGVLGLVAALALLIGLDRKSTRLNSSHSQQSRMPSSA